MGRGLSRSTRVQRISRIGKDEVNNKKSMTFVYFPIEPLDAFAKPRQFKTARQGCRCMEELIFGNEIAASRTACRRIASPLITNFSVSRSFDPAKEWGAGVGSASLAENEPPSRFLMWSVRITAGFASSDLERFLYQTQVRVNCDVSSVGFRTSPGCDRGEDPQRASSIQGSTTQRLVG